MSKKPSKSSRIVSKKSVQSNQATNKAESSSKTSQPGANKRFSQAISIICGVIVAVALIGIVIWGVIISRTRRLECTSSEGDITVMYDDHGVTGYSASTTFDFDLGHQQSYAEHVGIEAYLTEFEEWFLNNTGDGVCTR